MTYANAKTCLKVALLHNAWSWCPDMLPVVMTADELTIRDLMLAGW